MSRLLGVEVQECVPVESKLSMLLVVSVFCRVLVASTVLELVRQVNMLVSMACVACGR